MGKSEISDLRIRFVVTGKFFLGLCLREERGECRAMSETKVKALLVLGCGYLGSRLVEAGLERGWTVKVVSKGAAALEVAASRGAKVFAGMVDEDTWHGFAGEEVDYVVNCVSSGGGGMEGYRRSYVGGNQSLARWTAEINFTGRVIYTSSVGVYPDAGGAWVDEGSSLENLSERGAVIAESEQIVLNDAKGSGLFALRLGGLYGPGRHLMLDGLREGPEVLPGWGDYSLNLVRIEDVVTAVFCCLETEGLVSGIYNVVDDEPAQKEAIVSWLSEKLEVKIPRFSGEAGGRSSRRFGEGGRPSNRRISNGKLKAATDWQPRYSSFREGYEELLGRQEEG